jgi:hypothetical protein
MGLHGQRNRQTGLLGCFAVGGCEHVTGLNLYLNSNMIDANNAGHIRKVLKEALDALDKNAPGEPPTAADR